MELSITSLFLDPKLWMPPIKKKKKLKIEVSFPMSSVRFPKQSKISANA